jgi:hypothetical protein
VRISLGTAVEQRQRQQQPAQVPQRRGALGNSARAF